jgi:hypothetical protein
MTDSILENITRFIDHLTRFTIRIVKVGSDRAITGLSSGFLYQSDVGSPIVVITAGHKTPPKGVFIETRIIKDGQMLCVNAGKFTVFSHSDNIDYAYSRLPMDIIQRDLDKNTKVEYIAYRHKFLRAKKREAYGFAVWNNYEFIKSGNALLLPRYCCYEVGMELIEQDEHINYFKTAGSLKEDEYYQGASGSPIADPEGRVTSILVSRTKDKKYLKGFRLDNTIIPV